MSRAYGYTSYGGPETETWFDRSEPVPGPSDLVIKVKAVGVNPADYKIRSGAFANPQATPHFPLVMGAEAAGVVVAVGSDVEGFAQGDDVMGVTAPGHGSYAEHAVLLAQATTHKPPQVSFVQAAALPVAGGTAWDALDKLGVTEGETLLINGDGGQPMRHVAILITNPARIVSVADPSVTELEAASCSPAGRAFPPSPTWSPPAKSIPRCSRPTPSTKHHRHCEQWSPVTRSARS
jgi:D-arabinose 1-dehydrogenase-like Zn-dependent alcohol dehydrogenase